MQSGSLRRAIVSAHPAAATRPGCEDRLELRCRVWLLGIRPKPIRNIGRTSARNGSARYVAHRAKGR